MRIQTIPGLIQFPHTPKQEEVYRRSALSPSFAKASARSARGTAYTTDITQLLKSSIVRVCLVGSRLKSTLFLHYIYCSILHFTFSIPFPSVV